MRGFNYFVKKIPPSIYHNARAIFSTHMAIFLPASYVFDRRMEVEEYHFVICFETPPLATINGKEYQFRKGSIICLAPGDDIFVHSEKKQGPARYMTICVLPTFMNNIYAELGGLGTLDFESMHSRYSHLLLDALDALIHEVVHNGDTSPLMISSLEQRLAIQLIRDAKPAPPWISGCRSHVEDIAHKACTYIETYYTSNITIRDISDAIFVSPSYLQKIFPKIVGKTPHQYIMECRHRKARGMLVLTRMSMEEVARQCGFVNSSHFSTTFKQMEGISPLAFRKAHPRQ
jgi:AraC-like DNA-binding protein